MEFDNILEALESDQNILHFEFNNTRIPMYFMIRFLLLQTLINQKFNLSNPHVKANHRSIIKLFYYIYHTLKSNLFLAPQKNIYIFSSDILNIQNEGKYKNRLHDAYCHIYADQIQLFEISSKLQYKIPKNRKVFFLDSIFIISRILSVVTIQNSKNLKMIEQFLSYLNQKIALDENQYLLLRRTLIKQSKSLNIQYFLYKLFLKIKKPKILIIDCAHYGTYTPLMIAAKELKIITAEYQHGYVGLAHPAYNFHKHIFNQIRNYLPDYFLTHGKYWSDRVRLPASIVEIGLAELEIQTKYLTNQQKRKRILFISGGTVYEELGFLISSSYKILQNLGYEIYLRPHPSELIDLEKRFGDLIKQGLLIDNLLLYDSLSISEIVVGIEVSTVLFEAIYFTKKIFMRKSAYTEFYEPKSEFLLFKDATHLCQLIESNRDIGCDKNNWWDENVLENFKAFFTQLNISV